MAPSVHPLEDHTSRGNCCMPGKTWLNVSTYIHSSKAGGVKRCKTWCWKETLNVWCIHLLDDPIHPLIIFKYQTLMYLFANLGARQGTKYTVSIRTHPGYLWASPFFQEVALSWSVSQPNSTYWTDYFHALVRQRVQFSSSNHNASLSVKGMLGVIDSNVLPRNIIPVWN